jgi:hypothetical protein
MENEKIDDNNNENVSAPNEYDEIMDVDYPLFDETVLENDRTLLI